MIKALLWKEWRTQRAVLLGSVALAAVLPVFLVVGGVASSSRVSLHEISRLLLFLYALLIWPLFAAATAASAFAADAGDESLRFLLSRPVSRARVWWVKVGAALAAFVTVVGVTVLFSIAFRWLTAASTQVFLSTLRTDVRPLLDVETVLVAIPFVFVFGCSIYCSAFARRPLAAAVAGMGVAAGMAGIIALAWLRLVPASSRVLEPAAGIAFLTGLPLATVCILAAAFWVFRSDGLFDRGRLRPWQLPVAITVAVLLVGAVPATVAGMREASGVNEMHVGNLNVSEGHFVIPARTRLGLTTSLVRRSTGGAVHDVIVPRHATFPVLSPDGSWVVYVAYEGYFDNLRDRPHLRAVTIGGDADHAISGELPAWSWGFSGSGLLVAPDNDRVVFAGFRDLLITRISGSPADAQEISLSRNIGVVQRRGGVVGWKAGQPVELLYYRTAEADEGLAGATTSRRDRGSSERTELLALDPASGESRLIETFPGQQRLQVRGARVGYYGNYADRSWSWLPVWVRGGGEASLQLIDTESGERVELTDSPCDGWAFSEGGSRFLYGTCSGTLHSITAHAELRIYDVESRTHEVFAVVEGFDHTTLDREWFWSPDGEHLLFYSRRGYGRERGTYLLARTAPPSLLSASAMPIGWIGAREALLMRDFYGDRELQRMNVETGVVRTVFP